MKTNEMEEIKMKTKRIKAAKENVSKGVVELKDEDLENVVGGEIGDEVYRPDEKYYMNTTRETCISNTSAIGGMVCEACGGVIKSKEALSVKGVSCPKCGHFNKV